MGVWEQPFETRSLGPIADHHQSTAAVQRAERNQAFHLLLRGEAAHVPDERTSVISSEAGP